ncbi:1547_t:CDS:10 [Ambispora gerdemannii]|uniref:1547_t:CDS:1 n=1 Tax=Ambispora gerdemannii TaxID=144530 RepID=A0A9N8WAC1_9GLOM|nr:1547_t:CDS:10 [Ambispora gerdemannii]
MQTFQQTKEAIESCIRICLSEKSNDTDCINKFTNLLEDALSENSPQQQQPYYSNREKTDLLECVYRNLVLISEENNKDNKEKITLIKQTSWEIFNIVLPYLTNLFDHAEDGETANSTTRIARQILEGIAKYNPPREMILLILEKFSFIDWENFEKSFRQVMCIIEAMKIDDVSKFLPDTIKALVRALSQLSIEKHRQESVIESVIEFCEILVSLVEVDYKNVSITDLQSQHNSNYYLLNYLFLSIFDKCITPINFEMASTYYETFYPRYYNVPGREKPSKSVRVDDRTRLNRLVRLAIKAGIAIDQLLSFVIDSTYLDSKKPQSSSQLKIVLPLIISSAWLINKIIPVASNGFSNGFPKDVANTTLSDKILLVLLYFTDRIEEGTITSEYLEKEISDTKITIMTFLQSIASFASTCPNSQQRFVAFRLLSRVIDICSNDVKAIILNELLINCPFETMKTATISIIKENIASSLSKVYDAEESKSRRPIGSIFSSSFVVTTFIPKILRFQQSQPEFLRDESAFTEKYSYIMQGLNFYYLLLSKDKENLTTVWDTSQIRDTQKEFLDPLREASGHWISVYQSKLEELKKSIGEDTITTTTTTTEENADKEASGRVELEIPVNDIEAGEESHPPQKKLSPLEELQMIESKVINMQLLQNYIDQINNKVLEKREKGKNNT